MAAPAKKKPVDLELVLGVGKPKGKPAAEPDGDEMLEEGDAEDSGGAFDVAADEFLDEAASPDERKAALKRAIMACMGGEY